MIVKGYLQVTMVQNANYLTTFAFVLHEDDTELLY